MTKPNKFTDLKAALRERLTEGEAKPVEEPRPREATDNAGQGATPSGPVKRSRGRPKGGKRNNPQFQQVTLYIPSMVYVAVQNELRLRRRKRGYQGPRDMSELVGGLVQAWHKKNLNTEGELFLQL
jgi:hypothetical protein